MQFIPVSFFFFFFASIAKPLLQMTESVLEEHFFVCLLLIVPPDFIQSDLFTLLPYKTIWQTDLAWTSP